MELKSAKIWAQVLSQPLPKKVRPKKPKWSKRHKTKKGKKVQLVKQPPCRITRASFTDAQKKQITWHALYHINPKKYRLEALERRDNWWLLWLMMGCPEFAELEKKTGKL